ncbi:MAG: DNA alkylation repair protein [Tissierellia bacterium]|nr:DNA alkylation repair protein [Tissierellia bacterium]
MKGLIKESVFFADLLCLADSDYKKFTCNLVPNVASEKILGIRIPMLRKLAKQLCKERPKMVAVFLGDLPHGYYDENNLHGLFISEQKDFQQIILLLDQFLPLIDNWATCDIISPKIFKKHRSDLLLNIQRWMLAEHEYTIRFGIEMLMTHFLDEDFQSEYLKWVVAVQHEPHYHEAYYVKMMIAWFFATALAKQYKHALQIIEQGLLESWTHNKAIQKAKESRRISDERKHYLQSLKKS